MMFVKRSNQCLCTVLSIIITMASIVNPIKSYSQTNYSVKMPEEASTILQTPVLEHRIAIEQVKKCKEGFDPYFLLNSGNVIDK